MSPPLTNPPLANHGRAAGRRVARQVQLLIAAACAIPAFFAVLQRYLSATLNYEHARWQDLVFTGGDWLALSALVPLPFYLGGRFPLRRSTWRLPAAVHVGGAVALAVAWASLGMLLGLLLQHFPAVPPLLSSYLQWILITLPFAALFYFAVVGCAYGYSYFMEAREREADASRLSAQLAEARLGALRMQLNPHFLFNSLNTVAVLVRDHDSPGASRVLELLAGVLRQVLRSDRAQQVPFADELAFVEQYLAIEQVRFSDRLRLEWSIDERARAALVPDFVMQPLVENAIRHGIAKREGAGTIAISAKVEGGVLELSVRDDGVGMEAGEAGREGIGLSNTRERLRTLYGDAAEVSMTGIPGGGARVVLRFPYRTAPEDGRFDA